MRVHLLALPHSDTTRAWDHCAYTAKIRRLAGMLVGIGHEVILYGGPENEAVCTEHVVVVRKRDRKRWWRKRDWHAEPFDQWDAEADCWRQMNNRVMAEMRDRIGPRDIIAITAGRCQEAVVGAFPDHVSAEVGVGYEGVLTRTHRCFESSAWRHYLAGRYAPDENGRFYDVVIPNAYDPADFAPRDPDGYLLHMGRLTSRKGTQVAIDIAAAAGLPLILAGQGDPAEFNLRGDVTYEGVVVGDEKAKLLAGARALLAPTLYLEPFGGVAVEAMMSGTPAITTDFGAFPETVHHGLTGFRCRTLAEFVGAVAAVDNLDREAVAAIARQRFSTSAIAPLYGRWLHQLSGLYDTGWSDLTDIGLERHGLDN